MNGQPAERSRRGLYPRFLREGIAAPPCACDRENGMFQISTNADKDGAVEGGIPRDVYVVVGCRPGSGKTCLVANIPMRKKSTFRAKVSNGATELPPFELTIDPACRPKVREITMPSRIRLEPHSSLVPGHHRLYDGWACRYTHRELRNQAWINLRYTTFRGLMNHIPSGRLPISVAHITTTTTAQVPLLEQE